MMRASTHIYPFIFFFMFVIGVGIVTVRALSGDVEVGLGCVAIRFARGEWVLVEVGGSKKFLGLDC